MDYDDNETSYGHGYGYGYGMMDGVVSTRVFNETYQCSSASTITNPTLRSSVEFGNKSK
jgi:hypothetical protein